MILDFETALRLTEILMAFAFIQQSLEHLSATKDLRALFVMRLFLCGVLLIGVMPAIVCLGLFIIALMMVHHFQGPYNGGSDRMSLLLITCLTLIHILPDGQAQYFVFGYLALQLVLSYVIAGWVKIINPEWRNGRALIDVFNFSIYPISETTRAWAHKPKLLLYGGWLVMVFEIAFPLFLVTQTSLFIGLGIAALFHFANHYLFGFNRFFWIWIAAFPSLVWLQGMVL